MSFVFSLVRTKDIQESFPLRNFQKKMKELLRFTFYYIHHKGKKKKKWFLKPFLLCVVISDDLSNPGDLLEFLRVCIWIVW